MGLHPWQIEFAENWKLDGKFILNLGGEMLTTMVRKYRVGALALFPLFLFAVPRNASAQAGKAEEGQKLFEVNCAKCHGPDGSGNTPIGKAVGAKDLRAPEAQKLTDAQIFTQIDQGKGNMPPFGDALGKAKINDLVAYVHVLTKKAGGAKKAQ
jgi:mono/diheme cytochrome c family protein